MVLYRSCGEELVTDDEGGQQSAWHENKHFSTLSENAVWPLEVKRHADTQREIDVRLDTRGRRRKNVRYGGAGNWAYHMHPALCTMRCSRDIFVVMRVPSTFKDIMRIVLHSGSWIERLVL